MILSQSLWNVLVVFAEYPDNIDEISNKYFCTMSNNRLYERLILCFFCSIFSKRSVLVTNIEGGIMFIYRLPFL